MEKVRMYEDWLLELKEKLAKPKRNVEARLTLRSALQRVFKPRKLGGGNKVMTESEERKWRSEVCAMSDEMFQKYFTEDLFQTISQRKYKDTILSDRLKSCHVANISVACAIGAAILYLAFRIFCIPVQDPEVSLETESVSYALRLVLIALLSNTAVGIILTLISFTDIGYHDTASELELKLYELEKKFADFRTSLCINQNEIPTELINELTPITEGSLSQILSLASDIKLEVAEAVKRIEPIVQRMNREYFREDSSRMPYKFPVDPSLPKPL